MVVAVGGRRRARVLALGWVAAAVPVVVALAAGPARAQEPAPGAGLTYHGYAALDGGRVDVRLTPRNHGPSAVPDATVRLRWSVPLARRAQPLPPGCARTGERDVMCRTGALDADGWGGELVLGVWLRGRPAEVTLDIATVWAAGAVDRDRGNDRQRLLVLDTGDTYSF
ncbi:hypothetical protein [Streptomyces galbus]|uniref:hypothetical protein n=1 Tax=Streptomyces galbus TaxID=33898 RepID=UPI0019A21B98|nr:hypothetical protein GCM10010335_58270 [Streptomyces galbus]